ncbi:MAG: hypothetical protein LBI82_04570 [Dysgonamonadaceae bacterium]|nr:hypothetical protein [Dysgonamonadaceae bacterium]
MNEHISACGYMQERTNAGAYQRNNATAHLRNSITMQQRNSIHRHTRMDVPAYRHTQRA